MSNKKYYEILPDRLSEELANRKKELERLIHECNKALESAPEGNLRISRTGKRIQYYHRTNPKDKKGKYILQEKRNLALALAQKDYDEKLYKELKRQYKLVSEMKAKYGESNLENIFGEMNQNRQQLIEKRLMTNLEFAENWIRQAYLGKQFDSGDTTDFYTAKGERVRSKSEVMIANTLNRYHVPYRYEYPIYIRGYGEIHPDFLCLNMKKRKEIIWEHFGMMGKQDYADGNTKKLEKYILNGIYPGDNLITTIETISVPLSTRVIEKMIEKYLL